MPSGRSEQYVMRVAADDTVVSELVSGALAERFCEMGALPRVADCPILKEYAFLSEGALVEDDPSRQIGAA